MTEYWVSQGNKWCDFCKIYIANNPLSIRTHELGQRHKDNVAKRLSNVRKESAAREKEEKKAVQALQEIETKAKRSYEKDLASFQTAATSSTSAVASNNQTAKKAKSSATDVNEDGAINKSKGSPAPGVVISTSLNRRRVVKGAQSSIAVNKRKRNDEKPKVISKEEAEALKAREAARKRVAEREKPLMGLYRAY